MRAASPSEHLIGVVVQQHAGEFECLGVVAEIGLDFLAQDFGNVGASNFRVSIGQLGEAVVSAVRPHALPFPVPRAALPEMICVQQKSMDTFGNTFAIADASPW